MLWLRNSRAFTLIEILFVMVVIGILAAIIIPRIVNTAAEAKIQACKANVANINTQIERYYFANGTWPAAALTEMKPPTTYDYFPDDIPTCPVDGSAYTMSTTTHRVSGHSH